MPPKTLSANQLLNTLTPAALAALQPALTTIDLPLKKIFDKGSKSGKVVFFPCSGMFSMIRMLEDGSAGEVGLIGNEGFVGVPLLLGASSSPLDALVQAPGKAITMSASTFQKVVAENPPFRKRLLLYAQYLHVQVSQTAVCNSRHKLPQRLARWILETHDRMHSSELTLSHEFLSYMLGVRRAGISVALQAFTTKGFLTTRGGKIVICDRPGIEKAACECYRTVQRETKRLLPKSA